MGSYGPKRLFNESCGANGKFKDYIMVRSHGAEEQLKDFVMVGYVVLMGGSMNESW